MKQGLIIGKGWLGSKLETYLSPDYKLTTTKRNSDAENCISVDFDKELNTIFTTNQFDFIVITIPFGKRNTIEELQNRFNQISNFIGNFKNQIILISSSGIYPNTESLITENTFIDSELNEPYITIENMIKSFFPQLTILRLGGLMGDDRFLSKYLTLDKPNLTQTVNHIHYHDVCQIIKLIIKSNINQKIYNLVSPLHPTKEEILEFQLNNNLIQTKDKYKNIISSNRIIEDLHYSFIHPNPLYFFERI